MLFNASFYSLEPPCWKRIRQCLMRKNKTKEFGFPDCDKDGYFKHRQCLPLTGCHCVDKYGIPKNCEKSGCPLITMAEYMIKINNINDIIKTICPPFNFSGEGRRVSSKFVLHFW